VKKLLQNREILRKFLRNYFIERYTVFQRHSVGLSNASNSHSALINSFVWVEVKVKVRAMIRIRVKFRVRGIGSGLGSGLGLTWGPVDWKPALG